MSSASTVILRDLDPDEPFEENAVEFRLTYQGPLKAASNNSNRANHKHEIRKAFHPQLKRLWAITGHLRGDHRVESSVLLASDAPESFPRGEEELANRFSRNGYRFVPLVTRSLNLICALEILYMRPDAPGDLISAGDIDNRLKTLFDALRITSSADELGKYKDGPDDGEDPFFCLLEDDSLITKVSVETDTLLDLVDGSDGRNDARLVITVHLRPREMDLHNMRFG